MILAAMSLVMSPAIAAGSTSLEISATTDHHANLQASDIKLRSTEEPALTTTDHNTTPIKFSTAAGPLRIGVIGLAHGHVEGLLWNDGQRDDITIVGIVEPDDNLFTRLVTKYKLSPSLRCKNISELALTRPEAVSVMTDITSHLAVARECAPHGIHMLFEKPLAYDAASGNEIAELGAKHGVLMLTNFETSWYASVRECNRMLQAGEVGTLRRLIFRHGHSGPVEIGCSQEFLAWLTDPDKNGGGAITDFGCYGAVLSTWLMKGERPTRIAAAATTLKPKVYPRVDDDATIILTYPSATATIQASWAWTHDNKEMDVHAEKGSLHAAKNTSLTMRPPNGEHRKLAPPPLPAHLQDEWTYLTLVVRGKCEIDPLSSTQYNVIVAEILGEARKQAAKK